MLLILELYSCYVSTHWESRVEMGEKGRPGGPAGVLEDQVVCLSTQRWGHALGLRSTWQPAFTKMGQLCFALFYALCARAPDPCNAHRPPPGSHAGLQCWASNSLRGNYFHRAYKLHLTKPSQKNLRFHLHWKSFDAPVFPGRTNIIFFFPFLQLWPACLSCSCEGIREKYPKNRATVAVSCQVAKGLWPQCRALPWLQPTCISAQAPHMWLRIAHLFVFLLCPVPK